jgi:hypothetical protein
MMFFGVVSYFSLKLELARNKSGANIQKKNTPSMRMKLLSIFTRNNAPMNKWLQKHSTTRNIIYLVLAFILFNPAFQYAFKSLEADILDIQLFYTAEKAYSLIEAYGEQGRITYIKGTLILDYIYPWIYSLMLSLIIFRLSGKAVASAIPFLILILDYLENTFIISLLWFYPREFHALATIAGIITLAKWLLAATSLTIIIYYLTLKAFSHLTRKKS